MPIDSSAPRAGGTAPEDEFESMFGDFDDPFATELPAYRPASPTSGQKRGADSLGLDQEVEVQKKARMPQPKLDEHRLLGKNGLPALRKRADKLKLKGKGHEYSDAVRLLEMYQFWLDDMYPRTRFKDGLVLVEKLGHKGIVKRERMKIIDELKPKPDDWMETGPDGEVDIFAEPTLPLRGQSKRPEPREASVFGEARDNAAARDSVRQDKETGRLDSIGGDDIPDDFDDLFGASPRRPAVAPKPAANQPATDDFPDEDDLDALLAEAEMDFDTSKPAPIPSARQSPKPTPKPEAAMIDDDFPDEDDLDALMAEAEMDQGASIFQ